MNLTSSTEIETVLSELDQLLMEGYLTYRNIGLFYESEKAKKGFSLEQFLEESSDTLNGWFRKVVVILEQKIKERHYLVRFLHRETSSMMRIGIPEKLSKLLITFEEYITTLTNIILTLEEKRNLAVRQEIAEAELQTDILYKITYSDHTREVKINKLVLCKLQSDSKNLNFFEYVFSRPNIPINMEEIEEHTAMELGSNIHDILRDLGFKDSLRTVFFPVATKKKVVFMNPISKAYSIKNDLPAINIGKTTRRDEKEREK